jgi:hypothetical protein
VRLAISVTSSAVTRTPTEGAVVIRPSGGGELRVPWAITFDPPPRSLLGVPRLRPHVFTPSATAPALLNFRTGRIIHGLEGDSFDPIARVDVELFSADGTDMGLLARLRDVLPGTAALGLTGRDPAGAVLSPGAYRLELTAYPTAPGPLSRRSVTFEIK